MERDAVDAAIGHDPALAGLELDDRVAAPLAIGHIDLDDERSVLGHLDHDPEAPIAARFGGQEATVRDDGEVGGRDERAELVADPEEELGLARVGPRRTDRGADTQGASVDGRDARALAFEDRAAREPVRDGALEDDPEDDADGHGDECRQIRHEARFHFGSTSPFASTRRPSASSRPVAAMNARTFASSSPTRASLSAVAAIMTASKSS